MLLSKRLFANAITRGFFLYDGGGAYEYCNIKIFTHFLWNSPWPEVFEGKISFFSKLEFFLETIMCISELMYVEEGRSPVAAVQKSVLKTCLHHPPWSVAGWWVGTGKLGKKM